MKKVHIVCLVTNDLNYDQRMIRICGTLAASEFNVTLVGRKLMDSKPLLQFAFRQKRLSCWFNKGKLFYLEYNIRLFFLLLFSKWDIVNAVDLDTILAATAANVIRRKKLVYDAHEYFTEVPELEGRPLTKSIWEWIAKTCIPKANACYTVGQSLQQIFQKRYKTTFGLVRNVPVYKPLDKIPKKEKKILLYQGALNKGRGIGTAILAMKQLPNMELWLAGEGDLSNELRRLSTKHKLYQQVKFLGRLSPDELAKVTAQAWLGLNLLEAQSLNYYYSLANKFFDYMQAGVPSVNMDFPEYKALTATYKTGILLEKLDSPTLVKAVAALVENPNQYQTLVETSIAAKERLHWANEKSSLLKIYTGVLER